VARYQPALLGGLFIGVLSALPYIGGFNACCCLWVVVGGGLTTYLLQQNDPQPIDTSVAALGGLIAGAVGGVITSVWSAVRMAFGGDAEREAMRQIMDSMRDLPPEAADLAERLFNSPALALLGGAVTVPVFAIFGLLGALLGVAFFRKKGAPPAAPAQPIQIS